MKTLKEAIQNKEESEERTWIRIHNRRFIIQDLVSYSMYANDDNRILSLVFNTNKTLSISFEKEEEAKESRRVMKILDNFFTPVNYNEEDSNYF